MGKGWTEEWQGLGCREGGGKVGCAKAPVAKPLNWPGLG